MLFRTCSKPCSACNGLCKTTTALQRPGSRHQLRGGWEGWALPVYAAPARCAEVHSTTACPLTEVHISLRAQVGMDELGGPHPFFPRPFSSWWRRWLHEDQKGSQGDGTIPVPTRDPGVWFALVHGVLLDRRDHSHWGFLLAPRPLGWFLGRPAVTSSLFHSSGSRHFYPSSLAGVERENRYCFCWRV